MHFQEQKEYATVCIESWSLISVFGVEGSETHIFQHPNSDSHMCIQLVPDLYSLLSFYK